MWIFLLIIAYPKARQSWQYQITNPKIAVIFRLSEQIFFIGLCNDMRVGAD